MVAKTETISESQFRWRFLRSGLRHFRADITHRAALPPHARCTMRDAECWRSPAGGKKQYYLDQEMALYLLGGGNNGRYYDAATGRFLSEDPTKEAGGDANLFRYAGNNPINNLDPSGHSLVTDPPKQVYHPVQNQPTQQHNANVHSKVPAAGHGAAVHGATGTQGQSKAAGATGDGGIGKSQPLPKGIQHSLLHKPQLGPPPTDPAARKIYDAELAHQQAQAKISPPLITGTAATPGNPSPIAAAISGALQGAAGVMWKFNNAMTAGLWSKVQPVNPNPSADKPTLSNAISDQFVGVAAAFFPIGGAEESGARDIAKVGDDVGRQLAHSDVVPGATAGAKTAAEQTAKSTSEELPGAAAEHEATQAAKEAKTATKTPAEAETPAKGVDETRPQHGRAEHDATAFNEAKAWQKDPKTVQVRFNQNLVDANGKEIKGFRPDVQRIRTTPGGKKVVDVIEVQSPGQTREFMIAKIAAIKKALGSQAGNVTWMRRVTGATREGGPLH